MEFLTNLLISTPKQSSFVVWECQNKRNVLQKDGYRFGRDDSMVRRSARARCAERIVPKTGTMDYRSVTGRAYAYCQVVQQLALSPVWGYG